MGLFKQAEFAKICGIHQAYLTVNRKRKKIIVDGNGLVDDAIPINALFKQRCLARKPKVKKEAENAVAPPSGDKPEKKITPIAPKPSKRGKMSKEAEQIDERYLLDTEKRRAEIRKLARETETAEMRHEKFIGKLAPTEAVKSLFIHTIKNYTMSFKQAADKVVQEFAKRTKMNRNDMAVMKSELVLAINHASENADMESKKGIKAIVTEYAETKEL